MASVIIPCYNERETLQELYKQLLPYLDRGSIHEIILVDDASRDGTLDEIKSLNKKDNRIKYMSLSQNCGHQMAIYAGLMNCKSDFAITMDADLQHPPKFIEEFLKKLGETDADVLIGRRVNQQSGFLKVLLSKLFYFIFRFLTPVKGSTDLTDFALYRKNALNALQSFREPTPFLRGMIFKLGLKVNILDIKIDDRVAGQPSYTFQKSLKLGMNALFDFSKVPIYCCFILGVLGMFLSFGYAAHYLYLKFFTDALIPGQADLLVLIGISTGSILLILSFILRKLTQVLEIVKNVPQYIVKESELS